MFTSAATSRDHAEDDRTATQRRSPRRRAASVVLIAGLVIAACSDDDDGDGGDAESGSDAAESDEATPTGDPGVAVVALDNGERFEFSDVRCALESEFIGDGETEQLFSALDFDFDDEFDLAVTQFGEAPEDLSGAAFVTVTESATFEDLWDAESTPRFTEAGGSLELTLSGTSITGSGMFFPGGDLESEPVAGTVTVNCIEL